MLETLLNIDNTIDLITVVTVSAIISPVIVSLITNVFGTIHKWMEHHHDLKIKKWEKYYTECFKVFSDLLVSSGKLLANSYSDEEIMNALALLYKSYSYADEQLFVTLDIYHQKLELWNNDISNSALLDDVQSYAITLSREINRFLSINTAGYIGYRKSRRLKRRKSRTK